MRKITASPVKARHLFILTIFAFNLAVIAVNARTLGAFPYLSQTEEKLLEKDPASVKDPANITNIKATKKSVEFGKKFDGDKDWLKGLELRLKNVSDKEIVYLRVDLNFPETKYTGGEMSFRMDFGRKPGWTNTPQTTISIAPGETVDLILDEQRYENLTRFVNNGHHIASINKAHVRVGFIAFADGTAWSAGVFYRQDPNNPRQWNPISN